MQVGLEKLIGLLAQDDLQLKTDLFKTAQEVRIELKQMLSEIKGNWTRLLWPCCGAFFLAGFTSGIFFVLCVLYLWFLH